MSIKAAVEKVGIPDFVWASPDCAVFSIASGNTHFDKRSLVCKTTKAIKSIAVVEKLYNDILWLLSINPNLIFWIENPNGRMKWLPFLQETNLLFTQPIEGYRVVKFDQCAYGRQYKKTTNLFTNDTVFKPKVCIGKKCHHSRNYLSHIISRKVGIKNNLKNLLKNLPCTVFVRTFVMQSN